MFRLQGRGKPRRRQGVGRAVFGRGPRRTGAVVSGRTVLAVLGKEIAGPPFQLAGQLLHRGPGRGRKLATDCDGPVVLGECRATQQPARHSPRFARPGRRWRQSPGWPGPGRTIPGRVIELAAAAPHRIAAAGQHVHHPLAASRNDLHRKIDPQQPADVIDAGRKLLFSLSAPSAKPAKPVLRLLIGKRRVKPVWMPKYPAAAAPRRQPTGTIRSASWSER